MDDLLRFLLGQVALCGKSGALPSEVFDFLKLSTAPTQHQTRPPEETFPGVDISATDLALVDPSTEAALWKWLTQHSGLFVGKGGQASHMTLDEVLRHNESAIAKCQAEHDNVPGSVIRSLHCSTSVDAPILKLYATEENIWQAVAGHGIDPSRIPSRDFDCLCAIAQHREAGIFQPSLVKLTKQDPRSVPIRTQRLCDGGYVLKIPTIVKGTRSSWLFLKQFAPLIENGVTEATEAEEVQDPSSSIPSAQIGRARYGEHEEKVREGFAILKDSPLIVWDDLKKKIGIFHDASKSRSIAAVFRRFERLGFVQRVSAQGAQDKSASKYHRCLKLLRYPTDTDLSNFFSMEHAEDKLASLLDPLQDTSEHETMMHSGTPIQWSASRQLTHIVRDAIDEAGDEGLTSQGVKESAVGLTYDRPMEHLLNRLVGFPKISQPAHLRHLGLLRDKAAIGRTDVFIHYARHRLESLLQAEKISDGASLEDSSSLLQIGSFGFPLVDKTALKAQTQARFLLHRKKVAGYTAITASTEKSAKPKSSTGRPRGRPRKDASIPNATSVVPPLQDSGAMQEDDAGNSQNVIVSDADLGQTHDARRQSARPKAGASTGPTELPVAGDSALTYREQEKLIKRPSIGIFVGQFSELRRPGLRGRRPRSRLAIIKTSRLLELPWFITPSPTQPKEAEDPRKDALDRLEQPVITKIKNKTKRAGKPRLARDTETVRAEVAETSNQLPLREQRSSTADVIPNRSEGDGELGSLQDIEVQEDPLIIQPKLQPVPRSQTVGSSVAAKRRQIILDIVNSAGGVYPGGIELWYAFATQWQQYVQSAQPDPKTVKNLASALVDCEKLHRITFNFQNKNGMVTVKTLLTLPDVAPEDERVRNLQERMITADPRYHFPEGVQVASELRPYGKKPLDAPRKTMIPVEEGKVDMHYIPAYLQPKKRKASHTDIDSPEKPKAKRTRKAPVENNGEPKTKRKRNADTNGTEEPAAKRTRTATSNTPFETAANDNSAHSSTTAPESDGRFEDTPPVIEPYSTYRPTSPQPIFTDYPIIDAPAIDPWLASSAQSTPPAPKRKRAPPRQGPKPRKLTSLMDTKKLPLLLPTENQDAFRRMRARGPHSRSPDDVLDLRVYIATLIAKLLLGGIEQITDWKVVASMLDDGVVVERLRNRWNHTRESFKGMGEALNDELREQLANGFEDGSLECVNYDDIYAYDWKALLDWTIARIDPSRFYGGLPASRAILLGRYDVVVSEAQSLAGFYEEAIKTTIAKRRVLLHKHAYVEDLAVGSRRNIATNRQSLARSWVHAVMTTPDTEYDAVAATRKLSQLTENELIETIKVLRAEKVINVENKGRLIPARGYDFSEKHLSRLKSCVEADQLREAAKFKKTLDADFASCGRSRFDLNSRDGAFLALVNMKGVGHIQMGSGARFPTSLNLLESGYITRQMDKAQLIFGFDLEPTPQFQSGNPLDLSLEPPRCQSIFEEIDGQRVDTTKIPMWYDVNGRLVPVMWEAARAMVAVSLSLRPGLTVSHIVDAVKPILQPFEVELVLRWYVDIGAAAYADGAEGTVKLKEWWWMMLADEIE